MKQWKRFAWLPVLALAVGLLAGCGPNAAGNGSDSDGASVSEDGTDGAKLLSGKHHAEIEVQDYGTIVVELDADAAPATVTNFVNLAKGGFYDGLTFHRVAAGFVLQGGDPKGNGTGGSSETVAGEFSENGFDNPLSHTRAPFPWPARGTITALRPSFSSFSRTAPFSMVSMPHSAM